MRYLHVSLSGKTYAPGNNEAKRLARSARYKQPKQVRGAGSHKGKLMSPCRP